ncbi:MAG: type I DNA topoisomerase [Clostridium sp.]|nr:type I DNA topoisomerase [Clostridium sp.]MCM1444102.1 type I DNA topoisomerase [Candidatus Amulumruptor caecigallinarius]
MSKNLVIVESPSKSKTIEKYLGKDYTVLSSKGHVRDLSTKGKYGLGVDIENNFKPDYVTIKGKKKDIDFLKKAAKESSHVYIATDPDREGEAIAWHLYDVLELSDKDYDRIVFNEITKPVIIDSLKSPRKIDYDLVNSQETRRILDRIIGFRLSKLIQSKTSGTSAGRVQSVALKLIVDREREIAIFNQEEYWTIDAIFNDFTAELFLYKDKEIEIKTENDADKVLNSLSKEFKVLEMDKKSKSKKSKFPYTTSTLQQDASNKLGMSAKKTMSIAQKLYEGIELENETVGLITYMRTDAVRLSDLFVSQAFGYIKNNYGENYIGYVKKSNKTENVQDAHESIRPTSIDRTPISVKAYLTNDEYKLYKMIYFRTLASLMSDAKTIATTLTLENNDYKFKATAQELTFDGYLKVYSEYEDTADTILPDMTKNDIITSDDIEKKQHFTQPPARFTEAKLIKEMEELGIGRPSTYAKTIDNIKTRGYVTVVEKKFEPTEIGIEVTDKLQECFSNLINVEYTAKMEDELDEIAEGKLVWHETLKEFYSDFEANVKDAFDKLPKKEAEPTGEMCPECGNPLVYRDGRYGKFIACSNFPSCKYIKQDEKTIIEIIDCPNCDGKIVEKKSRKGKVFYGCNNYPKCSTAYWDKPIGKKCPNCGNMLLEKNKKIKCSNCDYME